MSAKKSTTLYRPFLRDAWRLTWERKSLWIFGIFAALISTGGILDVMWRSLQRVEQTESLLKRLSDASFIGYDVAASYFNQLDVLGTQRTSFLLVALTLAGMLLIVIATLSQGALILGIRSRLPKDPHALRCEAGTHAWSLFLIAVLNKLLMLILTVLMTLPLLLISVSTSLLHGILFFVLMLVFLPATLIVNIIYMLALMDTVENGSRPLDAIYTSVRLFAKHWLATFEYATILFLIVLGAGAVFFLPLLLLFIPYSVLYVLILSSGSLSLFLTFNVVWACLILSLVLAFGGACVTFQYSAWYSFYKHSLHKTHGKKIFSKILRLAQIHSLVK
ncbi:hypothetical protein HY733_03190 [Candidatus Uhrbacteria bacterium]|nr:hypothetical protein [Candidatus Uhrbacteria bacterium]